MTPQMLKLLTHARISKLCLDYFGFKPSRADIAQKLGHINRINNRAPCNIKDLLEHIQKCMMAFIAVNYPLEKRKVIEGEIRRMKKNPPKQLPLP